MQPVPLAVVVLTFNEALNVRQCLQSVMGWAGEVFVVDSLSTDGTISIAREYGAKVIQHEFRGYADQRNWALSHLPFSYDWVFFLDADEAVSQELREEIAQLPLPSQKEIDGFYVKYRFVFMGRWIRHGGYYPTWLLRLFRWRVARCDERGVDEHCYVSGPTGFLKHDLIHKSERGISDWIDKHNRYATLEALELLKSQRIASRPEGAENMTRPQARGEGLRGRFWGSQTERKRWMRERVWNRLPPLIRPFLYFFYRYVFRLGFLDGKEGFIFHFLQGLWYRLLVDIKLLELRQESRR